MGCVIAFPNRLQGAPLTSPNVPVYLTNGRAAGLALCYPGQPENAQGENPNNCEPMEESPTVDLPQHVRDL